MQDEHAARPPAPAPVPPPTREQSLMEVVDAYERDGLVRFGHLTVDAQKLLILAKFITDMDCANYMPSNMQQLTVCMLLEGNLWRAHQRQVFHYEDGAWVMAGSLSIQAWDLLLALEGLFIQLAMSLQEQDAQVAWSWSEAGPHLTEILGDLEEVDRPVLQTMKDVAKNNSDHVRVKTSNKAWHARWTRRVADMIAKFRKDLELESTAKTLTKLFLVAWDSPMPVSCGVCFRDVFLDEHWNVASPCQLLSQGDVQLLLGKPCLGLS